MDNRTQEQILNIIIDLIEDNIIVGDDIVTISEIIQLLKENGLIRD